MKRLILVRSGSPVANTFSSISECINNCPVVQDIFSPSTSKQYNEDPAVTLSFFNQVALTFQLVGTGNPQAPLAISHYTNHAHDPLITPQTYHVLDLDLLCDVADTVGVVVIGTVQRDEPISAANVLQHIGMFARNPDNGDITDVLARCVIDPVPGTSTIPIVPFFSIIKVRNIPVYYIISDSRLLTPGHNMEIESDTNVIRHVTDAYGTIRDELITPRFSDNVEVLQGDRLFVTGNTFTISMLGCNTNLLRKYDVDITGLDFRTKSNFNVRVDTSDLTVTVTRSTSSSVGFLKLRIVGGPFLDGVATNEAFVYDYSITFTDDN